MSQAFGIIILCIAVIFVLYVVIFKAVKDGINYSVIGKTAIKEQAKQDEQQNNEIAKRD